MRLVVLGWLCAVLIGCAAAVRQPRVEPVGRPATIEEKRALFTRAHEAVAQRQYEQAIPSLQALLGVYPELQDYCLHDLALSYARTGDTARAEALWTRLSNRHAQSIHAPRAALERGRLRRAAGDVASAQALFAVARDGPDPDVSLDALVELAETDAALGNLGAAHARLMEVRGRAPGSAAGARAKRRVAELRGLDPTLAPRGMRLEEEVLLLLKERDFDAAHAAADRLLAVSPPTDRPAILRLRADAESGAGEREAALRTLQEIARHYPDSAAAPEAFFRYASLLWNRDRNAEAERAFREFARRYPHHARMPEVLYAIGRIEQSAEQSERAVASYALLADRYPDTKLAREARWRIGWIRYRQGRWRAAAAAFTQAAANADIVHAAEAYYWEARALERAGDAGGARRVYTELIERAPDSYYAGWAERRLGRVPAATNGVGVVPAPAVGPTPAGVDPYHWARARELHAAGLRQSARAELRAFERTQPAESTAALIAAYQAADGYRDAIRLAQARSLADPQILYPLAFWPSLTQQTAALRLDPLLVLALIRQESLFDPTARSPADARGLMQLLPRTAERVAHTLGRPSLAGRLDDPDTNLALGTAHLAQLLQTYRGDPIKALAAYNGGEEAVAKWERGFGGLEPDEFVESITYRETRDYVKRVLANYRSYRRQYAGSR